MLNSTIAKKLSMAAAGAVLSCAVVMEANPAGAVGFDGAYSPDNWTFNNSNANGSVNTTNAPSSITLTGGNNGSGFSGQTSYTTTAQSTGEVSFDWNYFTNDGPFWDPFGFLLNGSFTQLTNNNGSVNQSGAFSIDLIQGDVFGFAINTVDNIFGSGNVTVSNFTAPEPPSEPTSVPEPASLLGLLAVGAFGAGSALKRKQKA